MSEPTNLPVDPEPIREILKNHQQQIRLGLRMCTHCGLCADSCFLYRANDRAPEYMPSYKFLNSIGVLFKKKGKVGKPAVEEMGALVFENCVLCTRCYCPFGIDIPALITLGRRACRSQGVFRAYDK